ncbi:MAG: HigA family addiction module antidote protein [Deltaproteobacteria bacterium]|nr:HigA family addiction module antidote protein [Deltaproteobacteria bacterium]
MTHQASHPGEILLLEFLEPVSISQSELARAMKVPRMRISELVRGERSVSVDTALRLARVLNTTAEFWLNLQADYDLRLARQNNNAEIEALTPLRRATG